MDSICTQKFIQSFQMELDEKIFSLVKDYTNIRNSALKFHFFGKYENNL